MSQSIYYSKALKVVRKVTGLVDGSKNDEAKDDMDDNSDEEVQSISTCTLCAMMIVSAGLLSYLIIPFLFLVFISIFIWYPKAFYFCSCSIQK